MRRLVVWVTLTAAVLGVVAVGFYPSPTDFRPDNPSWNGLSGAAHAWQMAPLPSLARLPTDPRQTATVIIPYRPMSRADAVRIARYLQRGGVVIVSNNFGTGNQLLEEAGLSVRFSGAPLLDPLVHYRSLWLPRILDVPVLPAGSALVLNHATALTGTGAMRVMARSSRYSFLDLNGNGRADRGEPQGPFAVAAWGRVGAGILVAVSDPNLLINSMIGLGENRAFVREAFRLAGDHPRIFLDDSHLPANTLDDAKAALGALRDAPGHSVALLVILVLGIAAPLAVTLR